MEQASSAAKQRSRAWLPWALLAGTVLAAGLGGLTLSRSISALLERNAQLEREALESEARVAELQGLRSSMERRLRLLEQPTAGLTLSPMPLPPPTLMAAVPPTPPPAPTKSTPRAKRGKKAGRR